MKVLIVDDESPARERLRHLLKDFDSVEILGEAEDGDQQRADEKIGWECEGEAGLAHAAQIDDRDDYENA